MFIKNLSHMLYIDEKYTYFLIIIINYILKKLIKKIFSYSNDSKVKFKNYKVNDYDK